MGVDDIPVLEASNLLKGIIRRFPEARKELKHMILSLDKGEAVVLSSVQDYESKLQLLKAFAALRLRAIDQGPGRDKQFQKTDASVQRLALKMADLLGIEPADVESDSDSTSSSTSDKKKKKKKKKAKEKEKKRRKKDKKKEKKARKKEKKRAKPGTMGDPDSSAGKEDPTRAEPAAEGPARPAGGESVKGGGARESLREAAEGSGGEGGGEHGESPARRRMAGCQLNPDGGAAGDEGGAGAPSSSSDDEDAFGPAQSFRETVGEDTFHARGHTGDIVLPRADVVPKDEIELNPDGTPKREWLNLLGGISAAGPKGSIAWRNRPAKDKRVRNSEPETGENAQLTQLERERDEAANAKARAQFEEASKNRGKSLLEMHKEEQTTKTPAGRLKGLGELDAGRVDSKRLQDAVTNAGAHLANRFGHGKRHFL
ncbi:hypothetical protein DIPPA_13998 [Diplonema papillatum]|nr:hypothetical protein DIPPA_13998 [Diplonema papillatum]KAJ9471184.1 hypothetical protein DIPPA_13998 [Diplonema papillatum]|eukprot:gene9148-14188_t